jgi:hypothetical protein
MKTTTYIKILGAKAVAKYFNNPDGNLYFKAKGTDDPFQVCDGFDLVDIQAQVVYGNWEVIFIEGPNLGTNVEVA